MIHPEQVPFSIYDEYVKEMAKDMAKVRLAELKAKLAAQRIIDKMVLQDVYGMRDDRIYPV